MPFPGLDASFEVVNLLEILSLQELRSGTAAPADGSVGNKRFSWIQFPHSVRELRQRYKFGTRDMGRFVLPWLTHVQEGVVPFLLPVHIGLGLVGTH